MFTQAIRTRVPDRIANHVILSSTIKEEYISIVANRMDRLKETMREHMIIMECCDDYSVRPDAMVPILNIVEAVQRNVAMGSIDLYLYSCALYLQADAILTRDSEFRNIIQYLQAPPRGTIWKKIRDKIALDSECFVIPTLTSDSESIAKIEFPQAFKINDLKEKLSRGV
jgi:hypothetical protein